MLAWFQCQATISSSTGVYVQRDREKNTPFARLRSLKAKDLGTLLSLMNEICEVRNSIRDIKAKKDVHSEQVKDNKRIWDELETKNTIIKLLIDNFKQLADSIGKSNTTVPLLQTTYFSENSNFILRKSMHAKNLTRNENQQIYCHQIAINYWNPLLKILN